MHYVLVLVFMLVCVERHVDSSKGMRGSGNDKLNDENELDGTTTNEAKRWIGYMDSAKRRRRDREEKRPRKGMWRERKEMVEGGDRETVRMGQQHNKSR